MGVGWGGIGLSAVATKPARLFISSSRIETFVAISLLRPPPSVFQSELTGRFLLNLHARRTLLDIICKVSDSRLHQLWRKKPGYSLSAGHERWVQLGSHGFLR